MTSFFRNVKPQRVPPALPRMHSHIRAFGCLYVGATGALVGCTQIRFCRPQYIYSVDLPDTAPVPSRAKPSHLNPSIFGFAVCRAGTEVVWISSSTLRSPYSRQCLGVRERDGDGRQLPTTALAKERDRERERERERARKQNMVTDMKSLTS